MGLAIAAAAGARRAQRSLGRWLSDLSLECRAQHLVLQELVLRIERAEVLGERVAQSMVELLPRWTLAPVVEAVRALPGISIQGAIAPIAEIGSFSRFETPRQLMAFPGLLPSEHSSGSTTRREPIAETGNSLAHTRLVEAAWTYRFPARVSRLVLKRTEHLPKPIRTVGWKAQVRLCRRYRHLMATGKAAPPERPWQGGHRHRRRVRRLHLGHGRDGRAGAHLSQHLLTPPASKKSTGYPARMTGGELAR